MGRYLSALMLVLFCWNCKPASEDRTAVLKDVWRLEQAQINSFDPTDAYHAYHIQLTKQLFNTLTDVDTTGRIVPSLAESWHSDDGCHWIFQLREDVLFVSDPCFVNKEDRLFTAKDVQYTFERLLSKDSQSLGVSYFTGILGVSDYRNGLSETISGIEVIDNHTVSFVLAESNYNFPSLLSLPFCSIVKEKAIKAYDPKTRPIGTGPFQLESYFPDERISLVRNEDYWEQIDGEKVPYIKRVELSLTTDDNFSFLLFKNRKTDFIELNTPLRKQSETTRYRFKTRTSSIESVQLNFYLFNLSNISDANIRKGISYAIDRGQIQAVLDKEGTVTYSLYPNVFMDLHMDNELLESNREKAQELLKDQELRLKMVTFDDILSRSIATRVKLDLAKFNVSVDVESVPFPVLVDRLSSGDYDLIQLYWGMLYADPDHFLSPFKAASFPPEGNNYNMYSNDSFEEMLKTALRKEGEEQADVYRDAEDVILNDMPFVLLYYKNLNLLSNKRYWLPMNPLLYKFYKYAR